MAPPALTVVVLTTEVGRAGHAEANLCVVPNFKDYEYSAKFTDIADDIAHMLKRAGEGWFYVLVDFGAVGVPAANSIQTRLEGHHGINYLRQFISCVVSPGAVEREEESRSWGKYLLIPHSQLVGVVKGLLQEERLRINPDLPGAAKVRDELWELKPRSGGPEDFIAFVREKRYDNITTAVALGCWAASNKEYNYRGPMHGTF